MKYFAICPVCGKRLCKAEEGSSVDIQCPDCKEQVEIIVSKLAVSTKRHLLAEQKKAVQVTYTKQFNMVLSEKSPSTEYYCRTADKITFVKSCQTRKKTP